MMAMRTMRNFGDEGHWFRGIWWLGFWRERLKEENWEGPFGWKFKDNLNKWPKLIHFDNLGI